MMTADRSTADVVPSSLALSLAPRRRQKEGKESRPTVSKSQRSTPNNKRVFARVHIHTLIQIGPFVYLSRGKQVKILIY